MTIVPAILTDNLADASRAMGAYQSLSRVVHVDVLDNTLVAGQTILPAAFPKFERNSIAWHLMVKNPEQYFDECLEHKTEAILIHAELAHNLIDLAEIIHKKGVLAGLVLNPRTPIELVESSLVAFDWVQIMTVEPGKQGGEFLPKPLAKLAALSAKFPRIKTSVDGGVTDVTIHQVARYRPAMIVAGSYLAPGPTLKDHWKELKQAISSQNV